MASAIYDNPKTARRELWTDKERGSHICETVTYEKGFPETHIYMGMPAIFGQGGQFEPGRVQGDPEAIAPAQLAAPIPVLTDRA